MDAAREILRGPVYPGRENRYTRAGRVGSIALEASQKSAGRENAVRVEKSFSIVPSVRKSSRGGPHMFNGAFQFEGHKGIMVRFHRADGTGLKDLRACKRQASESFRHPWPSERTPGRPRRSRAGAGRRQLVTRRAFAASLDERCVMTRRHGEFYRIVAPPTTASTMGTNSRSRPQTPATIFLRRLTQRNRPRAIRAPCRESSVAYRVEHVFISGKACGENPLRRPEPRLRATGQLDFRGRFPREKFAAVSGLRISSVSGVRGDCSNAFRNVERVLAAVFK